MPEVNAVGDLVLTTPEEFRALADQFAIALTDQLRRSAPATTADLAAQLDESVSSVDQTLEELEQVGIVTSAEDGWRAVANGFVFEIPEDPKAQAAARALMNAMLLQYVDLPRQWVAGDEPRLDVHWARAAGLFNARPVVTSDELRAVQQKLEELLAPYLTRAAEDVPLDARRVRILAYFLPGATPAT
jgi:predicted transcriptional regulator